MREHESIDAVQRNRALTPRAAGAPSIPNFGRYRYLTVTVKEAIGLATSGDWQLPDFQREFVWKPSQLCDLADSLWRDYPIGALLLWFNREANEARRVSGGLIADGLHRLTSLCLLFGREPQWLESRTAEFRQEMRRRFAVYFDVEASSDPRFVNADSYDAGRPGLIPLESILALNPELDSYEPRLRQFANELYRQGCHRGVGRKVIADRLRTVAALGNRELLVTALYYDRAEVIEIFQRLNSRGMKFRRLLLKFAMQGISGSLPALQVRSRSRSRGVVGRQTNSDYRADPDL